MLRPRKRKYSTEELEARWAERDARNEQYRKELEGQAAQARLEHIAIVEKALVEAKSDLSVFEVASVAVDALQASGIVFARMGDWEDW